MDKKALTDNIESNLDNFFGQDEEAIQHQKSPPGSEKKKFPLQELKAIVLSLDWEISDESMNAFINQIDKLSIMYKDDKVYMAFLSILGSLGRYIKQRKVDSHPDAIKILISVFNSLEKIVLSKDIIDTEKNIILTQEIKKYNSLKQDLINRKIVEKKTDQQSQMSKNAKDNETISIHLENLERLFDKKIEQMMKMIKNEFIALRKEIKTS